MRAVTGFGLGRLGLHGRSGAGPQGRRTRSYRGGCVLLLVALAVLISSASAPAAPLVPPVVTGQPDIGVVAAGGGSASFVAAAAGSPVPSVQWQMSSDRLGPWTDVAGATASTLTVPVSDAGDAFRAVFTSAGGTAISRPAKLVSTSDWMRDLGSDIGNVPLTELTIPGAHDMGTYGITSDSPGSLDFQAGGLKCDISFSVCNSYARAQDPLDATQELNDGIRYFDLRVCGQGEEGPTTTPADWVAFSANPVTCHGLQAASFADILSETRAFVVAHPGEVVYLDVNHLYQADPGTVASQIEQAFALPGGGSLLIPPQYCSPGNPDSGTCAGNLTLNTIAAQHLGSVIVNFEDDPKLGGPDVFWDPAGCDPSHLNPFPCAFFSIQPPIGLDFYDSHPLLWGRIGTPATFVYCTVGGSEASCFGNDSDVGSVLARVKNTLDTRQSFAEEHPAYQFQHFFVQFLQTTPDTTYILENLGGSLFDMANESNPVIGPAIFGCNGDWGISACFGQDRPENLNILAINFYNRTDYGSVHFDFVREVLRFDEYARTAPVVTISSPTQPAATGWYNAAVLGGQGKTLSVQVAASDYRYPTGITALDCLDSTASFAVAPTVPTTDPTATGAGVLTEGVHSISCSATDGAADGTHQQGNRGAGPGSTPLPATFKIDTTPPLFTPGNVTVNATGPGGAPVAYSVSDTDPGGSGPGSVSCPALSGTVFAIGDTTVSCTAYDVAGNSTSGHFVVHVKGAAEQLADLLTAVTGVGPGKALADKVKNIQQHVTKSQKKNACGDLADFIHQVGDMAKGPKPKISPTLASALTAQANNIAATLGC